MRLTILSDLFLLQSSGKSSVLESVVGKDFLPRGSGIFSLGPCTLSNDSFLDSGIFPLGGWILDVIGILFMQGLLPGALLFCSFTRLMKDENMLSLCTSQGRGSLILVHHLHILVYLFELFVISYSFLFSFSLSQLFLVKSSQVVLPLFPFVHMTEIQNTKFDSLICFLQLIDAYQFCLSYSCCQKGDR